MGLSIPGAIRLGKCCFVHGIAASKHATYTHLTRFGTNVVHGHTHRRQSAGERTVMSDGFEAWCPGYAGQASAALRPHLPDVLEPRLRGSVRGEVRTLPACKRTDPQG